MSWNKILLINRIFFDETFISAVEVIFFSVYLGLSFAEYSLIVSVCLLISMAFQLPTGYLSDRYGRKKMLLFSSSMNFLLKVILLFLPLAISRNLFYYVLLIESMGAMCSSLSSGNFEVLIFDKFKESNKDEYLFVEKSAKYFSVGSIIAAVSGFISTIFFEIWIALPLICDLSIQLIKIVSVLSLNERRESTTTKKYINIKKITEIKGSSLLILTLLLFACLFTISRGTFPLYQPLMASMGVPLSYYGFLIMIINLSVFILSRHIKRIVNEFSLNSILVYSLLVIFSQIILVLNIYLDSIVFKFIVISIAFSIMQLIRLFSEGMSSYFINKSIEETPNKTLIFSIYSMGYQILLSLLFFVMGVLEKFNFTYLSIYLIVLLLGIVSLLYLRLKLVREL